MLRLGDATGWKLSIWGHFLAAPRGFGGRAASTPAPPPVLKWALKHDPRRTSGPQPAPSLWRAVVEAGCREEVEPGV